MGKERDGGGGGGGGTATNNHQSPYGLLVLPESETGDVVSRCRDLPESLTLNSNRYPAFSFAPGQKYHNGLVGGGTRMPQAQTRKGRAYK